jgi:PIN domain nuclease of toxin-antitoxin system
MGRFAPLAWTRGYSLGDRVCLGAGAKRQLTILTAERKWSEVKGVKVKVIR